MEMQMVSNNLFVWDFPYSDLNKSIMLESLVGSKDVKDLNVSLCLVTLLYIF